MMHKVEQIHNPNSYIQKSNDGILTTDGHYDMSRISDSENKDILEVLKAVKEKYSLKDRAIGLANESEGVVYKPRYILFDIIIEKYGQSKKTLDLVAVTFAFLSKGAFHRKEAIEYYERIKRKIKIRDLRRFRMISPLEFYSKMAAAYEGDHRYDEAIRCYKLVIKNGEGNLPYFYAKIEELEKKKLNPKPTRIRRQSSEAVEFERQTREAAKLYLKYLD